MKKLLLACLMGIALVAIPTPADANHVSTPLDHCPNHQGNPAKVEGVAVNQNLVLAAGTVVCIKGSNNAVTVTANGAATLKQLLGTGHDVSYYIIISTPPLTCPPGMIGIPPNCILLPPIPITVSVCFEGDVTVFGPGLAAAVNAEVAAFLAANDGAVILGVEDECVEEPPTTTTTAPPVTTTTAPPVVVEKIVEVPVPQVIEKTITVTTPGPTCAEIGANNFPTSDRNLDADGDGIGCEKDAPTPAPELPRTGSGTLLTLIGAGLTGSGMILRRFFR